MNKVLSYIIKHGPCTIQQVATHFGVCEYQVHEVVTNLMEIGEVENAQHDVFIGEEAGVYLFDKTYQKS